MAVSPSSPTQRTSLQWHVGLVHNQGTQQPAPLISGECSLVPFEPYSVHLQPQNRPTGHHWPLGTTHEHAYGHTHTGAQHSATAVIVTVSMNVHRLISCTLYSAERLPAAIITCTLTSPGLQKARPTIGKNSLRNSLTSPAQSKAIKNGQAWPWFRGRQKQAGRRGCCW